MEKYKSADDYEFVPGIPDCTNAIQKCLQNVRIHHVVSKFFSSVRVAVILKYVHEFATQIQWMYLTWKLLDKIEAANTELCFPSSEISMLEKINLDLISLCNLEIFISLLVCYQFFLTVG